MRKLLLFSLLLFTPATPCAAQGIPEWEIFGGYSFEKCDLREYYKSTSITYSIRNEYASLHGWDASLTENMNRWFGGTLDLSGHYTTLNERGTSNREQRYSLLYGPRFAYRAPGILLFVHGLLGVAYGSVKVTPVGPNDSAYSFAMAAGTGMDVMLGKRAAVRLFKAEYFWTDVLNTGKNSFRASAGVIFYLGKKN